MLPQTPSEFRTQAYWSQFFEARNGRSFEWYVSFDDVRGEFQAQCPLVGLDGPHPPPVLVPGCGNSTISEDLWRAGYRDVHSIDFDPGVIAAMAEKTRGGFPGLAWSVESVADLSPERFPTAAYQAVLDKGLLDAMLPCVEEEGEGEGGAVALSLAQAEAYLEACVRVLSPTTGALFIVSLLQDHVLDFVFRHLVAHGGAHPGWGSIDIVRLDGGRRGKKEGGSAEEGGGGDGSPHCPFLLILKRSSLTYPPGLGFSGYTGGKVAHTLPMCVRETGRGGGAGGSGPVTRHTLTGGGVVGKEGGNSTANAAALAGVRSSVRGYRWAVHLESIVKGGAGSGGGSGGVFLTLDLWPRDGRVGASGVGSVTPSGTPPTDLGYPATLSPRYSLTLVDCVAKGSTAMASSSSSSSSSSSAIGNNRAVLLIPPGREHEYTFSTQAGLAGLGRGAGLTRLLGVARGVGEGNATFFRTISQAGIQAELSPVVRSLLPSGGGGSTSVPFLAVSSDGGQFSPIAEGCSPLSGVYVVEEGEWVREEGEGGEGDGAEGGGEGDDWGAASIIPGSKGKKGGGGGGGGSKGGSKGKQQKVGASSASTKPTPVPTAHTLRRLVFASNRAAVQTEVLVRGGVVDHCHPLRFSYHALMAAALGRFALGASRGGGAVTPTPSVTPPTVVVVGLGGGALPSYLSTTHKDAMSVIAIELDGDMVGCAVAHFGLPLHGKATLLSQVLPSKDNGSRGIEGSSFASLTSPGCVGVMVGDGLEFCAALAGAETTPPAFPTPLALVIDVNAGREDLKSGLSFPPPAFVTPSLLGGLAKGLLHSADGGGLLVMNVGARNPEVLARVISLVASAFPPNTTLVCTEVDGEDTGINTVVIAGSVVALGGGQGGQDQAWVPKGWVCSTRL